MNSIRALRVAFADAALDFLGTPFRLHGRDPMHGVDCVGLIEVSLEKVGRQKVLPRHYSLKTRDFSPWLNHVSQAGFAIRRGPLRRGDVILLRPGPAQFHLAIVDTSRAMIHAHAGLRRVVREPIKPGLVITAAWKLTP